MASRSPFNSVGGFSVGEVPANVVLANGDIITGNLQANATITANGNITANFFIGNGSQLTGVTASGSNSINNGNSNVQVYANANIAISSAGNANIVLVTGTGANIAGTLSVSGNSNVGNIGATAGVFTTVAGSLTTGTQSNITSTGTLSSLSVSGNSDIGNLSVAGVVSSNLIPSGNGVQSLGNATNLWSNLYLSGNTIYLGTATISSNATSITLTNPAGGQTVLAGSAGNNEISGQTLSISGQANIGNINTGIITATGNVTGNFFIGNGSQLTGITVSAGTSIVNGSSNVSIATSGGNVTTVVAGNTTLTVTGTGANITGTLSASGNVTSDNLIANTLTATRVPYVGSNKQLLDTTNLVWDNPNQVLKVGAGGTEIGGDAGFGYVSTKNVTATGNANIGNLTSTGLTNLGAVGNVTITGGSNGQVLTTNGSNVLSWTTVSGVGNVTWAQLEDKNGNSGPTLIALGQNAGLDGQGNAAIAIGKNAGQGGQGEASITIGEDAGGNTIQGDNAVAIGKSAGFDAQGIGAVAIGSGAGQTIQGTNAIAVGANAGITNQGNNSIILNATGANLNQTTANTFTVAPVRNDTSNIAEVMFYNTTSKEVTYGNTINVAGNITGANLTTGGDLSVTGNATVGNLVTGGSSGNISGANVITANLFTGTLTTASQPNITSTGTLTSLSVSGNSNVGNIGTTGIGLFGQVQIGGNLSYSDSANLIVVENKDGFGQVLAQNKNTGGNASMNIVVLNDLPGTSYMAMGVNSSNFTPLYNTLFEIPNAGYVSHTTNQVMGAQSSDAANSSLYFTYSSGAGALQLNPNGAIGWGASYNGTLTQGNFGNVGEVLTSNGASSPPQWTTISGGSGSNISNGTSNVNIATANGNVTVTSNGTANWNFDTTGNLTLPANTFSVNYANGTQVSLAGNIQSTISNGNSNVNIATANSNVTITSNGTHTWTFDDTGDLTLPTISLGAGLSEKTTIQSQRKIIPPLHYSVVITGTTPTVVYTATDYGALGLADISSMKVTIQIQHSSLGMEFFEVYATATGSDTYYSVSNRLQPPTITDTVVLVDLNGSNKMQITLTVTSGAATSYVTYDSTEFGIPGD